MGSFLRNQGVFCDEMMLLAIVRRLDTNGDAILTFDELAEFLKPDEPPSPYNFSPIPEARVSRSYETRGHSPMRHKSPLRSPQRVAVDLPPREVRAGVF